jgi:biopolymer transport protein ExbD
MPLKVNVDEVPSLNLTSMIDVLFLLIIFFMVGTRFTDPERNIGIQIPQVRETGALTEAPSKRVINVMKDGSIQMDERPMSLTELTNELTTAHHQYPELGVLVRGDAAGAFQNVASVLAACRQAGIADLGIAVRLAENTK